MDTKFELSYTKPLDGRWSQLVSVWFDHTSKSYKDDIMKAFKEIRQEFLEFMKTNYGEQELRWSLRWTDMGADIRFDNESDAASFLMLYTYDRDVTDLEKSYRKNSRFMYGNNFRKN